MNYTGQAIETDLQNQGARVQKSLTDMICSALPLLDRESIERILEASEFSLLGMSDSSRSEASPIELIAKLKARGLSRAKIAKALKLKSWRTVYTWEKGKAVPRGDNLERLRTLAQQNSLVSTFRGGNRGCHG